MNIIAAAPHLNRKTWTGDNPEGAEPCICCGRPVRIDRPHREVALGKGGSAFLAFDTITDEIENRSDFVGCFTIGPYCARRVPARFVQLVND